MADDLVQVRYEPCVLGPDGRCTRFSHDHEVIDLLEDFDGAPYPDEVQQAHRLAVEDTDSVHPSMVCWSCKSRNVASTDHDGHGQSIHFNPSGNGRFTVRCEDCGAVWEGQLRCVQPSLTGSPDPVTEGRNPQARFQASERNLDPVSGSSGGEQ